MAKRYGRYLDEKTTRRYAGMISEDRSKPSNLPTEPIMEQYPAHNYLSQNVEDTMYAQDRTMNNAIKTATKYRATKKY